MRRFRGVGGLGFFLQLSASSSRELTGLRLAGSSAKNNSGIQIPAASWKNGTERPLQHRDMSIGVAFVEVALSTPKMANERSGDSGSVSHALPGCGALYCFDLRSQARVPVLPRAASPGIFHNTRGNRP
jgi:hypothetical protein